MEVSSRGGSVVEYSTSSSSSPYSFMLSQLYAGFGSHASRMSRKCDARAVCRVMTDGEIELRDARVAVDEMTATDSRRPATMGSLDRDSHSPEAVAEVLRNLQRVEWPRAVEAWRGVQCLVSHSASADGGNRNELVADDFYYPLSFETTVINEFWSHSWRAPVSLKAASLRVYYNGLCSCSISILSALTVSEAFSLFRPSHNLVVGIAQVTGGVSFLLLLMAYRSSNKVFLDKVCINQSDLRLKERGIRSIGGFMRNTQTLLVILDKTYPQRLWCVFEIAAFMRLHSEKVHRIKVLPVFTSIALLGWVGSMALFQMAGLHFVANGKCTGIQYTMESLLLLWGVNTLAPSFITAYICRLYVAEMEDLVVQLSRFSMEKASCFCCSNNHEHPSYGLIPCDRLLVNEVLRHWWGSTTEFEGFVKSKVTERCAEQGCLRYHYAVMASSGYVWGMVGHFVWSQTVPSFKKTPSQQILFITEQVFRVALIKGPVVLKLFMNCACCSLRICPRTVGISNLAASMLVAILVVVPAHALCQTIPLFLKTAAGDSWVAPLAWAYMSPLTYLLYSERVSQTSGRTVSVALMMLIFVATVISVFDLEAPVHEHHVYMPF